MENLNKTVLTRLTTAVAGMYAGAMLLIQLALIPYWKTLSPEQYRESFQALGPHLGLVMIGLLGASIITALVTSIVVSQQRKEWAVVCVFVSVAAVLYPFVHGPINDLFLSNIALTNDAIIEMRDKWIFWHLVRTIAGIVGCMQATYLLTIHSAKG